MTSTTWRARSTMSSTTSRRPPTSWCSTVEAPMDQALAMADVLVKACEQLSMLLDHLREFKDLDKYWIEIHRLENDGDRVSRDAVASLFSNGIDPMVVIRWKDMFAVLEEAIDATETAAQILEGIVIKNS